MSNPKLMEAIAGEAKIQLAPPLYTDALGKRRNAGDTYIKMMQHNAKIFAGYLK